MLVCLKIYHSLHPTAISFTGYPEILHAFFLKFCLFTDLFLLEVYPNACFISFPPQSISHIQSKLTTISNLKTKRIIQMHVGQRECKCNTKNIYNYVPLTSEELAPRELPTSAALDVSIGPGHTTVTLIPF